MTVECIKFVPHASGALQGYASFRLPKMGIEIYGCGVFMKDGRRWVALPQRPFQSEGTTKYLNIVRFIEKSHATAFSEAALSAVDEWCAANATKSEEPLLDAVDDKMEDLPF